MLAWPCTASRSSGRRAPALLSPLRITSSIEHGCPSTPPRNSAAPTRSPMPYSAEHAITSRRIHSSTLAPSTESEQSRPEIHAESIHSDKTHVTIDVNQHLSSTESLAKALAAVRPPLHHPHYVFLAALLRTCGNISALAQGQLVHIHIIKCEAQQTTFLQNLLLQMYGKCGAVDDAYAVFSKMQHHDQHSWSFMIAAFNYHWEWDTALQLFNQLRVEGFIVDEYILTCIFSTYAGKEDLRQGKRAHSCLTGSDYEVFEAVANAVLCLYGRCHCLTHLQQVFTKIVHKTAVSWSTLIIFYTRHNQGKEAISLWCRMQQEAVMPSIATIPGVLDACTNLVALCTGKQVHSCLLDHACESEDSISTSLINMYGKCGDLENALKVFQQLEGHTIISWTALMAGYAQRGRTKEAFEIFHNMQQKGIVPNEITYVCILEAYKSQENLENAKQMHARIKHNGYDTNMVVSTALIKMYGRCGSPDDARTIFDAMPHRSIVTWNTILSVYAQSHRGEDALNLFNFMLSRGEALNHVTFIAMLSVCASEGAFREGTWMHDQVVRCGCCQDVVVGNALINMYSKCGQVIPARNVFERLPERSVISWNSMIPAYAYHGHGKELLSALLHMKRDGVHPNLGTFKVIVHACSRAGLVEDAYACLNHMTEDVGLRADIELYDCIIDLLGRTGRLEEVEAKIFVMPVQPSLVSWMTMLGACSGTTDLQRGGYSSNHVHEMVPDCEIPYIILSNMNVTAGSAPDADAFLSRMKQKVLASENEFSHIEVDEAMEFSFFTQPEIYSEVCWG